MAHLKVQHEIQYIVIQHFLSRIRYKTSAEACIQMKQNEISELMNGTIVRPVIKKPPTAIHVNSRSPSLIFIILFFQKKKQYVIKIKRKKILNIFLQYKIERQFDLCANLQTQSFKNIYQNKCNMYCTTVYQYRTKRKY